MPQSRKRQTGKKRTQKSLYPNKRVAPKKGSDKRTRIIAIAVMAALVVGGALYFLSSGGFFQRAGTEVKKPSGLRYTDTTAGTGASPAPGKMVTVNYTGTLEDGTKFDSSFDHGQPYTFPIGRGKVIPGWDEGVMDMKVGGKRRLIVPPGLGYGPMGSPPKIPGNATLIFDIELLDVK
ncbi:MAG: FKBP-type peptidyl-prolyl cis-trans isomerase [Pyrinomonadaceae bacterium]